MVSDSIINASIPNSNNNNASKDFGKKKRANRSAKLKQCKLDARREQWLSQVKNKGSKEQTNADVGGFSGPHVEVCSKKNNHPLKGLQTIRKTGVDNDGTINHDSDLESPVVSPTSSISCGNCVASSSSSSSSSGSMGGSYSGSITEEDEGGEISNDGALDDWEALADALAASDDKEPQKQSMEPLPENQNIAKSDEMARGREHRDTGLDKSKSDRVEISAQSVENTRAWRPDDTFRPQSLPNLFKQHSLPMNLRKNCNSGVNPWSRNCVISGPTCCPICYEDLDLTDSSFLPCSCGFRLCLFCHKRILEEDGRCPGCRKPYNLEEVEKETSVTGGSLTIRLNRSSSMFSRA